MSLSSERKLAINSSARAFGNRLPSPTMLKAVRRMLYKGKSGVEVDAIFSAIRHADWNVVCELIGDDTDRANAASTIKRCDLDYIKSDSATGLFRDIAAGFVCRHSSPAVAV